MTACPTCARPLVSNKAIGGHMRRSAACRPPLRVVPPRSRPIAERFDAKVDRSGGPDACWLWMGVRTAAGYGQLHRDGKHRPATHIALELDGRPLLSGQVACHRCDNPPCVNPAHLFGGTPSQNERDKIAKGRGRWSRGLAKVTVTYL